MNISLNPALEKMIQEKVSSGFYNSASEVIREALRLLFEREAVQKQRIEELSRDIDSGIDDLNAGRIVDGKTAMARLKAGL